MRATLKLIIGLAAVILVVYFIQKNPWINETYTIHYFGYRTVPIPLSLIILCSIMLGAVLVSGTMFIHQLKLRQKMREQARRLRQLEEELHSLRNLPLVESEITQKPSPESGTIEG
jgi:putative membrane protein